MRKLTLSLVALVALTLPSAAQAKAVHCANGPAYNVKRVTAWAGASCSQARIIVRRASARPYGGTDEFFVIRPDGLRWDCRLNLDAAGNVHGRCARFAGTQVRTGSDPSVTWLAEYGE